MYKSADELRGYMPHGYVEQELTEFFNAVQKTGLDPALKQITVIGKWDKRVGRAVNKPVVLIDGFRGIAEMNPGYQGQSGPFWCGTDGNWKDVWLDSKPPAAAKAIVYRDGFREPIVGVARYDGYKQLDKDGNVTHIWKTLHDVMIAKCAEAIALRRAFPQKLGGVYIVEELQQAGFEEAAETPANVTPIDKKKKEKETKTAAEKPSAPVIAPAEPELTEAEKAHNAEMTALTQKLLAECKDKDAKEAEAARLAQEAARQAEEQVKAAQENLRKAQEEAAKADVLKKQQDINARAEALREAEAKEKELQQIEDAVKEDIVCAPCVKCGCEVTGFLRSGQSKVMYAMERLGAVYCDTHGREEAERRRAEAEAQKVA